MNVEMMKEMLIRWNDSYRNGQEEVSDQEYDYYLNSLSSMMSDEEFEVFKNSLADNVGDVELDYILGGLDKIKAENPQNLWKWINKLKLKYLFISEKIDGMSFGEKRIYGDTVTCTTKGDGDSGEDILDKAKHFLPKMKKDVTADLRGELTLTNDSHKILGYKTRRAGMVGIKNEDEINVNKLIHVKPYVYQVLSGNMTIKEQFEYIKSIGYETPRYTIIEVDENLLETLTKIYKEWKETACYEIDGIVLSSPDWKNENVMVPVNKVSWKLDSEGVPTEIIDLEENITKGRLLKSVAIIKPVELCGTTVSRATCFNYKTMMKEGYGIGAKILITKGGDVIPDICGVIEKAPVPFPRYCPICDTKLEWTQVIDPKTKELVDGSDLICSNENCGEVKRVEHFIKQIGIENVSEKRLIEFGITTFEQLLCWTVNGDYKTQCDFCYDLSEKVFNNTPEKIMRSFSYNGFGTTLFDNLLAHVGSLNAMHNLFYNLKNSPLHFNEKDLPSGIGLRTLEKCVDDWLNNWEIKELIITDSRYVKPEPKIDQPKTDIKVSELTGKKVLFTGKFNVVRSACESKAEEHGAILVDGVTKNLDILFAAPDKWGSSSKFTKAQKLGIAIKTEKEFWEMIDG
jgi:DNA ligase (NAD+)